MKLQPGIAHQRQIGAGRWPVAALIGLLAWAALRFDIGASSPR
ncbi:MAG: hypothetical protein ACT4OM_06420 [Actinomycetota bacterium]